MSNSTWDEATAAATSGMAEVSARERRRHARGFAAWCAAGGLDPVTADRCNLEAYIGSLPNRDPQRHSKVRCALRAVLREIDLDHAARVAGLGNQVQCLKNLPDGLARLVEAIVGRQPKRRAAVASCLTRLIAWCREVDADPLTITPTDLPQFRRWLVEVATNVGETMVVAADFIELRYSAAGRERLGERPSEHSLLIDLEPPMQARFSLDRAAG
jgi:hypothetical protein